MQTKLTLRIDDRLIEKSKRWAKAHDQSLSELVARFFASLVDEESGVTADTPMLRRCRGILPSDALDDADYVGYLERKYR